MSFGEGLDGGTEGKDRSTTIWGLGPKADHELQQEGETLVSRMYVHACVGVCIRVYVHMCKSVACVCACVSMLVSVHAWYLHVWVQVHNCIHMCDVCGSVSACVNMCECMLWFICT